MTSRIFPLFALSLSVVVFFVYINPEWSGAVATKKASIASDDKALDAAARYIAEQNQLAAQRDAIDPALLSRAAEFLPDSVNNVQLILDLNSLAAKAGLSISNIDVTNATPKVTSSAPASPSTDTGSGLGASPVGSVDLSLSAVGTYPSLLKFLDGIERSQRLLDVSDLQIQGSDTGVYNYQMVFKIYWLR